MELPTVMLSTLVKRRLDDVTLNQYEVSVAMTTDLLRLWYRNSLFFQ